MVDFRGVPPAYMGNMTFHGVTDPSAKKSIAIEDTKSGSSLSGGSLSGQSRAFYDRTGSTNEKLTPETSKADRLSDKRDEKTNAGPPPSFQISILELERDLSSQLARMNAEQSLSRDVQAVSPTSSGGASDRMEREDPGPAIEASVPNPMTEPSYVNPTAGRSDRAERTETNQDPATQRPATETKVAENPAAQNISAQHYAVQGPPQPALVEGT